MIAGMRLFNTEVCQVLLKLHGFGFHEIEIIAENEDGSAKLTLTALPNPKEEASFHVGPIMIELKDNGIEDIGIGELDRLAKKVEQGVWLYHETQEILDREIG